MLRKSDSRARSSAMSAADGISIITPTGTESQKGIPSARSSSLQEAKMVWVARNSSKADTMGNRIRTLPWHPARRIARSWPRNISGQSKLMRMARHPRNGLGSPWRWRSPGILSPPRSKVRMMAAWPGRVWEATARYASNCSSSVGGVLRLRKRNSVRNRPMPLAPLA